MLAKQAREAKLGAKSRGPDPEQTRKAETFLVELVAKAPILQSAAEDAALTHGLKGATFRRALKRLIDTDGRVRRARGESDNRWWLHFAPPADAPAEGQEGGESDNRQAPPEESDSDPSEPPPK